MKKNKKQIENKTRNNNFARAVEWLIENRKVKEQKDIARMMGMTPATISRIKNGCVKHPAPETIRKFGEQFGELINIAYIRYESDIMLTADLPPATVPDGFASEDPPTSPLSIAAMDKVIAAKDETITALKSELSAKNEVICAKDEIIATKDALINALQQQIASNKESKH